MILNINLKKNFYVLRKNFNIWLDKSSSIIYIKGLYGIYVYKLPSLYFYVKKVDKINLLLKNNKLFKGFIKHFFVLYKNLYNIYSVRLKIRGLGYRIRKITNNLYYFFFNYTNMYYFYVPINILFKWYKKRAVLVSVNFFILKLLFAHILILKKLGPYRLRGLRYPRQILFIKKGGKKI